MQNGLFTTFDANCAPAPQSCTYAASNSSDNNFENISSSDHAKQNQNNNRKKRTIVKPTAQKGCKPYPHSNNTTIMQSKIAGSMQGTGGGATHGRTIVKKKSTNMFGVSSANEE